MARKFWVVGEARDSQGTRGERIMHQIGAETAADAIHFESMVDLQSDVEYVDLGLGKPGGAKVAAAGTVLAAAEDQDVACRLFCEMWVVGEC